MKKLISKIHSSSSSSSDVPNEPNTIQPVTPLDVLRYRFHHGTNLGAIFVLEKWLFPKLFPSQQSSELATVTASLSTHGLAHTQEVLTTHYRSALSDADLDWLAREARVTTIRLPIGYWTLGGGRFVAGTPFEPVAEVYAGAWTEVKTLVSRCRAVGIGVLLDLHGLPGGANKDAHSGTGDGQARLWGDGENLRRATEACVFLAAEARGMDGVVGVQVVNEACWGAGGRGMYEWYEEVIKRIAEVDVDIPIYVSDAWDLEGCLKWAGQRRVIGGKKTYPPNPVVVDAHRYYTFTEKDHLQSPSEIIARVPGELGELKGKEGSLVSRGEAQVVIGEWSCVMGEETWAKEPPQERQEFTRQFGQAQSKRWQEKAGGSFFWTLKMGWMDGGGWGFVEQTKKGHISPPPSLLLPFEDVKARAQAARGKRASLADAAIQSHEAFWAKKSPGKKFEHRLYAEGWDVGFTDALAFFTLRADGMLEGPTEGGDKIGCLEIWVKKRLLESGERGSFVWEWEQGFRAGVAAFYKEAGI